MCVHTAETGCTTPFPTLERQRPPRIDAGLQHHVQEHVPYALVVVLSDRDQAGPSLLGAMGGAVGVVVTVAGIAIGKLVRGAAAKTQ